MGTRSPDHVVLGVRLCATSLLQPSFRDERIRLGVNLLVVARGPERGDKHRVLRDGVVRLNGERLEDLIGHLIRSTSKGEVRKLDIRRIRNKKANEQR